MDTGTWLIAEASPLWISARGLGLAAWLASSAAVAAGLILARPAAGGHVAVATRAAVHRWLATATLVLAAGHIGLLLVDPYAELSWVDVLIPGLAARMTGATALGTISFVLLLAVCGAAAASLRLSSRLWRVVHTAALGVWPLATAHYILAGTDAMRAWSLAMLGVVGLLLAVLLVRRGWMAAAAGWVRVVGRGGSPTAAVADRVPVAMASGQSNGPSLLAASDAAARDVADGDVAARVDGAGDATAAEARLRAAGPVDLEVVGIARAGDAALTIEFERPPGWDFRAGQFLTLRVPASTGPVARCYSLSSAPDEVNLAVTVKRVPGGVASNWLIDEVRPGMRLAALPPAGRFVLREGHGLIVLLAAGSGITPIHSMVKAELAGGDRQVVLFYASADERTAIFGRDLRQLAADRPERLTMLLWEESRRGRPRLADVVRVLQQNPGADGYVCGPRGFMELVHRAARELGWDDDRLRSEEFASMAADPFRTFEEVGAGGVTADATTVTVTLDGQRHRVPWLRGHSLTEALISAGIDAPRSCMAGRCATCTCLVVAGEVETRADTATPGQVREGVVLGCQTRPVSDTVEVSYAGAAALE